MTKENNHDNTSGNTSGSNSCVQWFWIRHAAVAAKEGVFTGSSDVPANLEEARTEIKNLAENLVKVLPKGLLQRPDLWISSGLKRARQTAQALREALHKALRVEGAGSEQVLIDEALNDAAFNEQAFNEQDFGDWEGEPYDEVKHRALWDAPATHRPPNGESFADLVSRVACAIKRIEERIQKNIQENIAAENIATKEASEVAVVAVVHAGTIRAALAEALALPPQRALSFVIDPLSLTRIDRYRHHEAELSTSLSSSVRCVNVRQIQTRVKQEQQEAAKK